MTSPELKRAVASTVFFCPPNDIETEIVVPGQTDVTHPDIHIYLGMVVAVVDAGTEPPQHPLGYEWEPTGPAQSYYGGPTFDTYESDPLW